MLIIEIFDVESARQEADAAFCFMVESDAAAPWPVLIASKLLFPNFVDVVVRTVRSDTEI
jgi:hypothetical protein